MMKKKFKITTNFAATTTYVAPGTKVPKCTYISPSVDSGKPLLIYEKTINGQLKRMIMALQKDSAVDQGIVNKFVMRLRSKFPELTDQDLW